MATHDYVIANGTGAAVRSDLNDALAAIVSNNSSSSEPATTYAYQWWADTTANVLKIRNSANNAWITLRELDGTMLIEDGSASTPGLSFASDTNSGLFGGSDTIGFATGGAERLEIGSSEVVFNDPSNDVDFRVESNGDTHMLFIDAGNNRVGIGTSAPSELLEISTSANETPAGLSLYSRDTSIAGTQEIGAIYGKGLDSGGSGPYVGGKITFAADGTWDTGTNYYYPTAIKFYTQEATGTDNVAAGPRMIINSAGRVGIGATPEEILHIKGPSEAVDTRDGVMLQHSTAASTADTGLPIVWSGYGSASLTNYTFASICGRKENGTDANYSGYLQFATGSSAGSVTEKARIDSSGRLLVGTTADKSISSDANALVQIFTSSAGKLLIGRSDASVVANDVLGIIDFHTFDGGSQRGARIAAVADADHASGDVPTRIEFSTCADGSSTLTERMRISNNGRLLVGTSGPFSYTSTNRVSIAFTGLGTEYGMALSATSGLFSGTRWIEFADNTTVRGNIDWSGSAVRYNTSSDYRLKENVVPLSDALNRVKQLKPKRFNFIEFSDNTVDGFLAHEAQTVVPEAVTGTHNEVDDDGNPVYQGIDQSKLVPLLTAALQEAIAKIETLEAKVAALEAQ